MAHQASRYGMADILDLAPQWQGRGSDRQASGFLRAGPRGQHPVHASYRCYGRGGHITLRIQGTASPLRRQLSRDGRHLRARDAQGSITIPLDLAHAFGATLATLPQNVPYLRADPGRVEDGASASAPMVSRSASRQGNPVWCRPLRSIALKVRPGAVPNIRLINCNGSASISSNWATASRSDPRRWSTTRTASAGRRGDGGLDLLITSDTGPAHLAGAGPAGPRSPSIGGRRRWMNERHHPVARPCGCSVRRRWATGRRLQHLSPLSSAMWSPAKQVATGLVPEVPQSVRTMASPLVSRGDHVVVAQ